MGHHINVLIGRQAALKEIQPLLKDSIIVELSQDFGFIPITYKLHDQILENHTTFSDFFKPLCTGKAFAYIETDYCGGKGEQFAIAWKDGETISFPNNRDSAINAALFHLSVQIIESHDAFDSLGLGKHRNMDDWENYNE